MKKKIIALMILITVCFSITACVKNEEEYEKLKFYTYYEESDDIYDIVTRYNNYCLDSLDRSYQIEIVRFDTPKEMNLKISTEIMAGEGPDIFHTNQYLPFEKLIENDTFADINEMIARDTSENKLDMNDYKKAVMDAGVFDGKRYIIPLFYNLDCIFITENKLKKFDIDLENGDAVTYKNLPEIFESYFADNQGASFVEKFENYFYAMAPDEMMYEFILNYVDFNSKRVYFETEEFREVLGYMKKLIEYSQADTKGYVCDVTYLNNNFEYVSGHYANAKEGKLPLVFRGIQKNEDDYCATVEMGIAINSNTKDKQKALEFIKYALSDKIQSSTIALTGNFIRTTAFPVNNKTRADLKEFADAYTDDYGYPVSYGATDNEFMQTFIEIEESINKCNVFHNTTYFDYYYSVISDIVNDYLNDDISEDKFIRQLSSATKIYLNE